MPLTLNKLPNLLIPQLVPDTFVSNTQIELLISSNSPVAVTLKLYYGLKSYLYGRSLYDNNIEKIYEYMRFSLLESYYCIIIFINSFLMLFIV